MRFTTATIVAPMLLALACSTTTPAPPAKDGDFSYLRTPTTFRSFALTGIDNAYSTTYTAPEGWSEPAARNSFFYWNAVMAVRTGHDCFALESLKMIRREDIGTGQLPANAPAGPTRPGEALVTHPPSTYFEFTAITRLGVDCTAPTATDARDYLTRTSRPEQAPRAKSSGPGTTR